MPVQASTKSARARGNASSGSSQGSSSSVDGGDAASYSDHSPNDLTVVSGAALIMADCLGTGILALPADIHVLGLGVGLTFLILNLPINLYAGTILSRSATWVEDRLSECSPVPVDLELDETVNNGTGDDVGENSEHELEADANESTTLEQRQRKPNAATEQHPSEVHTTDFLGLTTALYHNPTSSPDDGKTRTLWPTRLVTAIYYINIFLVLGNYILVMSHAVRSMLGEENICLPTAGIIASILMYALAQLRTMANLGRSASVISLTALFIVVGICLASIEEGELGIEEGKDYEKDDGETNTDLASSELSAMSSPSISRQLAAIASIGFAVGSQKLLLNIRHEMAVKENASPKALGIALFIYGAVYVTVCVLAGDNPPSLLFDAIDEGAIRKFAGFLLWVHVAVSYAINSQALTSSIDRVSFHRVSICGLKHKDRTRWALLTFLISSSSYLVANAIPFFKDLVALIGALTSVPLTLLLPAILYRRVAGVPAFILKSRHDLASYLLVVFSLVFLLCGLFGALDSIELDWSKHGPPFSCS